MNIYVFFLFQYTFTGSFYVVSGPKREKIRTYVRAQLIMLAEIRFVAKRRKKETFEHE